MEGKSCGGGLFWLFVGGLPSQKVISLCCKLCWRYLGPILEMN